VRDRIAAAIFHLLNALLSPITLAGYVLWIAGAFAARAQGVSTTAQGPLSARWLMHILGTRPDEPASRLISVLPGVPPLAARLLAGPMLFAHRVTRYVPPAFRYPFEGEIPMQFAASARTAIFDKAIDRYLSDRPQLVILGAGFDTRALRLPAGSDARCFEVDSPRTQALKREMLEKAGIESRRIAFVSADPGREDWLLALVDEGFDRAVPTLFLWEGVTMYLEREAVEDTLRVIASTARRSVVAFDCFATEPLESRALYWR
jgi:methyltransferase (TIGR00027 family)